MAAPRKYTEKSLKKAVERYFASISRKRLLTERVDSGRRDANGHIVYEEKPVMNCLGEQAEALEYLVPPTVGGLCDYLAIHRSTWADWCDDTKYPEFAQTTTWARERIRAYLDQQLLTRKDVRGVIFDLQANHGCSAKTEVELGPRSAAAVSAASVPVSQRAALLQELMAEFSREDGGDGG